jgi:type IV pilus assembly protein PilV
MRAPSSGHRRARAPTRVTRPPGAGAGFSLIEVLVTLVIVALGLLGLAGLQAKLQVSEIEAYQRAQALLLVQDMADRIATNRKNAADYAEVAGPDTPLGTEDEPADDCTAEPNTAARDACEWSTALQGAAEKSGDNAVGAMVGARGCVEDIGSDSYLVTVAWQGLTPLSAPSAGLACGSGLYDGEGESPCTDDLCRRAVTTIVRIGTMD